MNSYDEGDSVKVEADYKDPTTLHDPTAVFLDVDYPDGTGVTYQHGVDPEIVKDAVGEYHAILDTAGKPGRWLYRWYATGTGQAADQVPFMVNAKRA